MGNLLSRAGLEGPPSPQRYGSRSTAGNIQGGYSGDSGSHNIGSSNVTINYAYYSQEGTNPSQNYAEILQCLYTSRYELQWNRVRQPVKGTCTWVTKHPKYNDWLGTKSSGLLWLSADPGCGKSVIASFLVDHLKSGTGAIVCYFFFKDDSAEQRSVTFALSAILHQLFVRRPELCKFAVEEFRAKGKRLTEEVDTLWGILVKAATEAGCGGVICVLDALDECEQVTLTQLIRHITRLPGSETSCTPLKFFVTSRPYHRIEREFGSRAATIWVRGEDEVSDTTADITRFIDSGVEELEFFWGNHGELGYLRNLLELSADRTFLWVSLVLEVLRDSEDCSREEFTNIVTTAPHDLAEFYTKILDKGTDYDQARRILNIVVAAVRPLTLREISVAFRISRDRKSIGDLEDISLGLQRKKIKNLCGPFVRIIDSKVYLVHHTAREFLMKGSALGHGNWQYTLCYKGSNFIMADTCITYLSLQDFEDDPLPRGNSSRATRQVENYVWKYAFLDYAASHWADHFRDSQDRQMELFEHTRLICRRGSNRFLTWLTVYWGNGNQYHPFPDDFTHLMIASWLGQWETVKRLLEEGGDIDARSRQYGTALNIAALRGDIDITRMLLEMNAKAYINRKEYNILNMKRSELAELRGELFEERARRLLRLRRRLLTDSALADDGLGLFEEAVIAFLVSSPLVSASSPLIHTTPHNYLVNIGTVLHPGRHVYIENDLVP